MKLKNEKREEKDNMRMKIKKNLQGNKVRSFPIRTTTCTTCTTGTNVSRCIHVHGGKNVCQARGTRRITKTITACYVLLICSRAEIKGQTKRLAASYLYYTAVLIPFSRSRLTIKLIFLWGD